ncbi:hypothetical protein [Campylobacter fetus]|uniref:Uncharacterized protein n=1 Tax=Campylobacter fetus subsp. testudinum TaxID=1507806 RepID=A0AAX0HC64_CAMFE|nr:hypothetical protein [Campylobacter fetus]AGZ81679.1 hypothetical protein CFT03427_0813 [Campylobacter fetus subsp. testudinum 03-427]AJB45419.1 hypothetical protein CR44_04135 [Campylobacter fetus subsp. testudinum]ALV64836.1 hypothetical protein CFTSP3_0868 [Campylobacter fetus subsp. testudinum Sp3]AVK81082.1 hypothetical protein C6B32_04345 [Campylobacter fetus subsp. testudinum]EAI4321342.1 hypothetical protein [Campylobacter fetus]
MMNAKLEKIIALDGTKKGTILVAHIDEPYGKNSNPIISIGVSLKGDSEPDWKVHIPYENLDELIDILNEIKKAKD